MDEAEKADAALRALYRGLPREEPPQVVDAAVLASARQSVAKHPRSWTVPASLAAVLVLAVAVTLRVDEENPEMRAPLAPAPARQEVAKAPEAKPEPRADAPVAGAVPLPQAQPRAEVRSRDRTASPDPARSAKAESSVASSPAFVPSSPVDASLERRALAPSVAAEAALPAATAPAAGQTAGQVAQTAARGDRIAAMRAESGAEASNLASAAPLAPEAWIERIIELRANARHKEADESYAEFRRRYPDYPVPAEKLQKIAPPR